MKQILRIAFLLLISSSVFAQKTRYEEKSRVFFGLNFGSTWHTSDVENIDHGLRGGGFIFGTSLNHNYGKMFSYDLRFRYLGGVWRGLDADTTGAIIQNTAVSDLYGPNSAVIQNFRAGQHRASIELAVHFNSLRERTGLDPYVFGGIGYTWTRTAGDFTNFDGSTYDFVNNPSNSILDGSYNTPLDMNANGDPYPTLDDGTWSVNVLPSLGFGLGYYFTNRFSVGFEHKSTLFNSNYFDGTVVNQNGLSEPKGIFGLKNDVYHYTSVYVRWYLKRANSNHGQQTQQHTHTPPPPPPAPTRIPPQVNFTNPGSSPTNVNVDRITLEAQIRHVDNQNNVQFVQDNFENHNFTYNPNNGRFQSTVMLKPGQNIFRLSGSNAYGMDDDIMIINYRREPNNPPIVNIVDPSDRPHTSTNPSRNVRARIQNVDNKNQINVTFNGQNVNASQWQFTPQNLNNFLQNLNLIPGQNTLTITATNQYGSDSDQITIFYSRQPIINENPPIVEYNNPNRSPYNTSSPNFNLSATIWNVSTINNVSFTQNGNSNNNFNFNPSSRAFSSNVILQPGANVFTLTGVNSAGTDQKTIVINYEVEAPRPPIVAINNPAVNPKITSSPVLPFSADVFNVSGKSQISMTINGNNFTQFTYDLQSKALNANLNLVEGNNNIVVSATNQDGSDSKNTLIIYRKPATVQPPVVSYISPANSPVFVSNGQYDVNATVLNVSQKTDVTVHVNGQSIQNFNFDTNSKVVSFLANLENGANTINITGTNEAGTDSKETIIMYRMPSAPVLPVVSFIDPADNPETVFQPNYSVIAEVLNVDGKSDITVSINGNTTTNFNYQTSNNQVSFTTALISGANIISIEGENAAGKDIKTTTIVYFKIDPVNPPVVEITNPLAPVTNTSDQNRNIEATVLNVTQKSDISVSLNGNNITNFNYNNINKKVNFNVNLTEGENNITVSAQNSAGTDDDEKTINYAVAVKEEPPFVSYQKPTSGGQTVEQSNFNFEAKVENVQQKSQINVKFNGTNVSANGFTFDPQNGKLNFPASLAVGNNIIDIEATNSAGSHKAITNIIYTVPTAPCDKPEISFVHPATQNTTIESAEITIEAMIHHVSNNNEITLLHNGNNVGNFLYNSNTHKLTRKVSLKPGNNVIELIAETSCGKIDKSVVVYYQQPDEPCIAPKINLLNPDNGLVTFNDKVEFHAALFKVEQSNQITVTLNNVATNFNFDYATHTLSGLLNLNEGMNRLIIMVKNECGTDRVLVNLERKTCEKPTFELTTNPLISNGEVNVPNINIQGSIYDANNVSVLVNGKQQGFNFNENTQSFSLGLNLVKQVTLTIVITAENACESASETFSVVYMPKVIPTPPTVTITQPDASGQIVNNKNITVKASITNIDAANQVSVTQNGQNINFNLNPTSKEVTFSPVLTQGNNTFEVVVVNQHGNAEASTIVKYEAPVVVTPPVVSFTNPTKDTIVNAAGTVQVQGVVTELTSSSQMNVQVNGQALSNFTSTQVNGGISFTIPIALSSTHQNYVVTVTGQNSAGQDQATISLGLKAASPNPGGGEIDANPDVNCIPTIQTTFTPDHKTANVNSDKEINKVQLQFSDGTSQIINQINGNTGAFQGTNANSEKCIVGIWIDSGCNTKGKNSQGEYFENYDYDGSCEITPCTPPTVSLMSETTVDKLQYNLVVKITGVTASDVNITHNGKAINCSYNASNETASCNLVLNEGDNNIQVVANGCEVITKNFNVKYTPKCDPISFSFVYPTSSNIHVTENYIDVNLIVNNAVASNITAKLNNTNVNFTLNGNNLLIEDLALNAGANKLDITMQNTCSNKTANFNIHYTPQENCGPRINPGNSDWQFCLITPSGTYNRSDLMNNNFTYKGPASSLYFLPIAGGSDILLNNNPYKINPGNYYLFNGNISVDLKRVNGQWSICIETDSRPLFGNGNNRPQSPCENTNNASPDNSKPDNSRPQGILNRIPIQINQRTPPPSNQRTPAPNTQRTPSTNNKSTPAKTRTPVTNTRTPSRTTPVRERNRNTTPSEQQIEQNKGTVSPSRTRTPGRD